MMKKSKKKKKRKRKRKKMEEKKKIEDVQYIEEEVGEIRKRIEDLN